MKVEFQKMRKDEHVLSQKVSLEVTKESSDGKTTAEKPHTTVEPQVHTKKKARGKEQVKEPAATNSDSLIQISDCGR